MSADGPRAGALRALADLGMTLAVSVYLGATLAYLVLTRRLDPGVSLAALVRGAMRGIDTGTLDALAPEQGHCFVSRVSAGIISDAEGRSRLRVFEDGRLLGPAHAMHADVRSLGQGRYSHWAGLVYLSASDNSDPRTNGRTYTFSTSREVAS